MMAERAARSYAVTGRGGAVETKTGKKKRKKAIKSQQPAQVKVEAVELGSPVTSDSSDAELPGVLLGKDEGEWVKKRQKRVHLATQSRQAADELQTQVEPFKTKQSKRRKMSVAPLSPSGQRVLPLCPPTGSHSSAPTSSLSYRPLSSRDSVEEGLTSGNQLEQDQSTPQSHDIREHAPAVFIERRPPNPIPSSTFARVLRLVAALSPIRVSRKVQKEGPPVSRPPVWAEVGTHTKRRVAF